MLREVYAARRPASARSRLRKFYAHCDRSDVRDCKRLAATIRAWEAEVLAFHTTGSSNGPTEGINLSIKKIKRVGHGFRNFTTTDSASSCTAAASNGRLTEPREYEAANNASPRRAR